jgi:hypothetical protein
MMIETAAQPMPRRRRLGSPWQSLPAEALLDVRLCDLQLTIEGSGLQDRVDELYRELQTAGLQFRPHVWFSEEWFSPDGVPGIAIPFYLGHPRLMRLERAQMLECEGASRAECLMILRHECGHALDNAYRLRRRPAWRNCFGRFSAPYPQHYQPIPASRDYVLHLNAWYAQAHPAEDFAETFAVWLADPRRKWRRRYARWPALKKLEAVEGMMASLRDRQPLNLDGRCVEPLSEITTTLREHYERKRAFYEVGLPTEFDADLTRVFEPAAARAAARVQRAAQFLSRHRRRIGAAVSRTTGVPRYSVDQMLKRLTARARALKLVLAHEEQRTHDEVLALLTAQVMNADQQHARIPL